MVLGTEKFNENRREGIIKLAEHGLLGGSPGNPDPEKIAKFLKENPGLDKKAIGEYISKKENKSVLNCFVHSFDLKDMRIDQALRLYLESFRLPGEAPLISLLLEKFAEHWHVSMIFSYFYHSLSGCVHSALYKKIVCLFCRIVMGNHLHQQMLHLLWRML